MKKARMYVLGAVALVAVSACGKIPQEELNATKASLDTLVTNGVDKFAPEDAKAFNSQMEAINQEIKVQEEKMFKDYDKTKQMLAQLKAQADGFKPKLDQIKEQQKADANNALNDAGMAISEAKGLLETAPVGKGSKADIEAMKMDVKGLEESLPEVQNAISSEDYKSAIEKAGNIRAKAGEISAEVQAAMERMAATKKK